MKRFSAAIAIVLSLGAGMPAGAAAQVEVAGPGAAANGFASTFVMVVHDQPLLFINADPAARHNIEAVGIGEDSNPWCTSYPAGACPIFASPFIDAGETASVDVSHLNVPSTYLFVCGLHRATMTGALTVLQ